MAADAAPARTPRLAARGLVKAFGATRALGGLSFELGAGRVLGVLGENGAGKSTLVACLEGALQPEAGALELDGRPYAPRDSAQARALGLAVIHQELALAPHLSVADNIALGQERRRPAWLPRRDRAQSHARARAALAPLGLADLAPEQRVGELPLSVRQRVEIARALSSQARVLVLDEPTSALGRAETRALLALLRELAAHGLGILYISHALEELHALADDYLVLRDGRSVASGAMRDATPAALVRAMVGREVSELYPRSAAQRGEPLGHMRALAAPGLAQATLELHRGEVVGLMGLAGAGRSELLRALFGLARVRSGELVLKGRLGDASPAERWAQCIGFLAEDRKREGLALGRPLDENLALPHLADFAGPRAFGRFARIRRGALAGEARRWIDALAIRSGTPAIAPARLSGGNQQKVALARLLSAGADLLLLDEPTRGIDVGAKHDIYERIDALARQGPPERRACVLLASSHLPELLGVCDRIAVLSRGSLVAEFDARGASEDALLSAALGGAA